MALGLQLPALALVETHHAGIREEADPFGAHLLQRLQHIGHQLLAQTIALIEGMNRHIPDRGLQHPVTGAAGKAHQPRHPWIVAPQNWIGHLPGLYNQYWPEERRLGRLHAMGYDAYQLIAGLYSARTGPMAEIDGATGKLILDHDGRIHRDLAWAQFQSGEPIALPEMEDIGGPIQDLSEEGEQQMPDAADEEPWFGETHEL